MRGGGKRNAERAPPSQSTRRYLGEHQAAENKNNFGAFCTRETDLVNGILLRVAKCFVVELFN